MSVTVSWKAAGYALVSPSEMAKADRLAVEGGVPSADLMEAAGRAVADLAAETMSARRASGPIVVLAGPGNNGGDGFVSARYLREWGFDCAVMTLGDQASMKGDAALMRDRFDGPVIEAAPDALADAAMIIDALFGAGLNKPLEGMAAELVDAANESRAIRIAVDLPSGLCGATGQVRGSCFRADATVTFFAPKPGHILAPGRFLCGGQDHLHVADIGIKDAILAKTGANTYLNDPGLWGLDYPHAGPTSHKYVRGHLLVLGGREPALGACRLASIAALRVGGGLVTLAAPSETYPIQAGALTDVLVRRIDSNFGFLGILADPRIAVTLLGPGAGIGEKTAELAIRALESGRNVVLDADALSSFAGRLDALAVQNKADVVLTPHEGEFARLFGDLDPNEDRLGAARKAAKRVGGIVVLKGVSTVIAAPDGRAAINANAPAWLSVGGTGDVLSGMIAGLMVQGMPAFEAACAAVWLHGEAAMGIGPGMIASDLLDAIPSVLP
ncbi:NAD(P)H-hydrate dehydratase [Pseudokordiimonas caeni]|uniref:NAD(P)H-hydrate dehydratase n=1 Tax=Pseudokordiimonas caeni TaxID=2997908 RepID=UPI00281161F9|nr:NAD(P)H-hydrate dehydratase [Pseudokordiimonas caeni]